MPPLYILSDNLRKTDGSNDIITDDMIDAGLYDQGSLASNARMFIDLHKRGEKYAEILRKKEKILENEADNMSAGQDDGEGQKNKGDDDSTASTITEPNDSTEAQSEKVEKRHHIKRTKSSIAKIGTEPAPLSTKCSSGSIKREKDKTKRKSDHPKEGGVEGTSENRDGSAGSALTADSTTDGSETVGDIKPAKVAKESKPKERHKEKEHKRDDPSPCTEMSKLERRRSCVELGGHSSASDRDIKRKEHKKSHGEKPESTDKEKRAKTKEVKEETSSKDHKLSKSTGIANQSGSMEREKDDGRGRKEKKKREECIYVNVAKRINGHC